MGFSVAFSESPLGCIGKSGYFSYTFFLTLFATNVADTERILNTASSVPETSKVTIFCALMPNHSLLF